MADRIPAYMQGPALPAQDDRLNTEDIWGAGSAGIVGNDSFRVTSGGGTTGMSVTVGPGRGIVASGVPYNGSYHVVGDAPLAIDLGGSDAVNYRRDAIIARVRDVSLVSGDGDSSFHREVVAGLAANTTNPPLPTLPARSFLIADVLVNPNTTTPAKITDQRQLLKPRVFIWQGTVTSQVTTQADSDSWKQVGNIAVANWPSWVANGGATCYHRVMVTGSAIAASELQFRTILGNTLDAPLIAGVPFFYKIYSPGGFVYHASGEYVLPPISTPFSQIQVIRVGSRRTALSFDLAQSVSVHQIQVVELPT